MKQRVLAPVNGVCYSNIGMYSPDGKLMSYVSEQKANWYLSRGLAEFINGEKTRLQLKFTPQGLGNHNHPFHMAPKPNICVVCGTEESLTRHHCVPRCFRKFFPESLKINASHDVVVMCDDCHSNYEQYASALKNELTAISKDEKQAQQDYIRVLKFATASMDERVPESRRIELRQMINDHFKREVSDDEIRELASLKRPNYRKDMWRDIVSKQEDLESFIKMWRKHFIEIAQPKYLPEHWTIDYQHNH